MGSGPFEPTRGPRVFATPLGVDFPAALVAELRRRLEGQPPEALAKVTLYVNTSRMQRRIKRLLSEGGATLLPRIVLVTDLSDHPLAATLPTPVAPLARQLELAKLVRRKIESSPEGGTGDAVFDLADSLATLLAEMQGEGVSFSEIDAIDVGDHSKYWADNKVFLGILADYLAHDARPDKAAHLRASVELLAQHWRNHAPQDPVIVAGSTGSRATTRALMKAVALLPQGALVLPGFDRDAPDQIWRQLRPADPKQLGLADHPQYRYAHLLDDLGITASQVQDWPCPAPVSVDRNRLISLALRPAPVTDDWLSEGPKLQDLGPATQAITLIEAPSPRQEALAIALRLRKAADDGTKAALISPDRMLTRQVEAVLQGWGIIPNDSAAVALSLTPPGRLLRMTSELMGQRLGPDRFLALLKHPLVCPQDRGQHMKYTRKLELEFLRGGPLRLSRSRMMAWADKAEDKLPGLSNWLLWVWGCIETLNVTDKLPLSDMITAHLDAALQLTSGPASEAPELWQREAGEEAQRQMTALEQAASEGGAVSLSEYRDLIFTVLSKGEVRKPDFNHPDIMIWGTLEARVQGADLMILSGLNDGVWPRLPNPDPWLNRDMRRQAGLPLPEDRVGLSAHDFQQAIAAPEVWLTRATQNAEAETVQSRWLNRIENLLNGLAEEGRPALAAMRARGSKWLDMADAFDAPRLRLAPAHRPSPQPPVETRPRNISVTQVETLIRDPYAIYARKVLGLKPLDALLRGADAAKRGEVFHEVLERFTRDHQDALPEDAEAVILAIADEVLEAQVDLPATRMFWKARLAKVLPWFLETEAARRAEARPAQFEVKGHRAMSNPDLVLNGRADRVDIAPNGALNIYDYKTGKLPSRKQQDNFVKQLPLLASIAASGGFDGLSSTAVGRVGYIGIGSAPDEDANTYDRDALDEIWQEFQSLIRSYEERARGYTARRRVEEDRWAQDYDQLARFGEWSVTDAPFGEEVG